MGFLANIKNVLIAAVIGLAVGFGTGFYAKSQFFKADQLDTAVKVQEQTKADIKDGVQTSVAVEKKADQAVENVSAIRKQVAKRLADKPAQSVVISNPTQQEPGNEEPRIGLCVHPDPSLDVGTVRLLNAAREGAALDPASLGDDASKAPSGIGIAELVDNDLEVVGLYQELAVKHNALVDFVEKKLGIQSK